MPDSAMVAPADVGLVVATQADGPLLGNLLELYIHDLSGTFALETGADGRFGYDRLSLYWTQPETYCAFLIRRGREMLAFHLDGMVTDGLPIPAPRSLGAIRDDPTCQDATTLILVEVPAKPPEQTRASREGLTVPTPGTGRKPGQ